MIRPHSFRKLPPFLACLLAIAAHVMAAHAAAAENRETKALLALNELGVQMQLGSDGTLAGVTLDGEKFTDESLGLLAGLENLRSVSLRNTEITGGGLAQLKNVPHLELLEIAYSPINDRAIDALAALKSVALYRLHGTRISDMGVQRLEAALAKSGRPARVEYHGGGFLGLSGSIDGGPCMIHLVVPDSAAQRAELAVGDVIQTLDGQDIPNFQALSELISKYQVGDKVALKIQRGGVTLTKELKLGKRPLP